MSLITDTRMHPDGAVLDTRCAASSQTATPPGPRALQRMLDIVDYPIVVVDEGDRVRWANKVANAEFDDDHPLRMVGGTWVARGPGDAGALRKAVAGALRQGIQTMVTLGSSAGLRVCVAVMPLRDVAEAGEPDAALWLFGRRQVCETLSTDAFARAHSLTLAETRVLKLLCTGCRPKDIATALGVMLSTVRTQISDIRAKTDCRDIGSIVQCISRLPPLPSLIR